jgi:uncharacterized protein with HEPN domain
MTRPEDLVRLQHLRDAAEKAIRYSSGKTRNDLDDDELLRLALTKLVEIVGEAAKQVSEPTRATYPEVPWRAAARMRDRLVHHYFDIDLDVLWETVTAELPRLLGSLPQSKQ